MKNRAIITNVTPQLENEKYFLKGITGEPFTVGAIILADGNESINASLLINNKASKTWEKVSMKETDRDQWQATFVPPATGYYEFKIEATVGQSIANTTVYHSKSCIKVSGAREAFSTWYEMFPRSASSEPGRHGTFQDCENLIPRIAAMGFDTLLFPPVFPIGKTNRKGKNNSENCDDNDVGSPWAVGNEYGGHTSLHPELGNLADFASLLKTARKHQIEIAMDLGFRCSPDHPLVKKHPEWFRSPKPDNLPLQEHAPYYYKDVVDFNFECEDSENLWNELKGIVEFWIGKGVRIFYSRSTHMKPFAFWNWLINNIRQKHPDVFFASGALVRPLLRNEIAKLGFSLSLITFMWKCRKNEITEFMNELLHSDARYFLRPLLFTNTPDVLPKSLVGKSENAFMVRYALAATLSSHCGIYGPAFELIENAENPERQEEYQNSEKYEVRHHSWDTKNRLIDFITWLNKMRRQEAALQSTFNLTFTKTDNEQIISFIKQSADGKNTIWCIINLDPDNPQSGYVEMPGELMNMKNRWMSLKVNDLMTHETYHWFNDWNYVELKPSKSPIHLLKVES